MVTLSAVTVVEITGSLPLAASVWYSPTPVRSNAVSASHGIEIIHIQALLADRTRRHGGSLPRKKAAVDTLRSSAKSAQTVESLEQQWKMHRDRVTPTALLIKDVHLGCLAAVSKLQQATGRKDMKAETKLHSDCPVMYGDRHYNFTRPRFGCLPWMTSALRHRWVFEIFPCRHSSHPVAAFSFSGSVAGGCTKRYWRWQWLWLGEQLLPGH